MSTIALSESVLMSLRRHRSAGESVKAMANEVGVTWQKLDKALRHGSKPAISAGRSQSPDRSQPQAARATASSTPSGRPQCRPVDGGRLRGAEGRSTVGTLGAPRAGW